jgi:hypothetical protein
VEGRDSGKEHDEKYERSGQVWKVAMTSETMIRHNPFLSGEVWISGELDLKQPPMKMGPLSWCKFNRETHRVRKISIGN